MTTREEILHSLQPLVANGTLSSAQQNAVADQLANTKTPEVARTFKALISEALVYLGAAVIFGSGALLIEQTWDNLGRWGRPGVLVLAALALWIAGTIVHQRKQDQEGRRLTSTLLTGAAALVGVAANTLLRDLWIPVDAQGVVINWEKIPMWVDPAQVAIAMSLVSLVAILAYRKAPSILALTTIGGTALGVSMAVGQLINYLVGPEATRIQYFEPPLPWLAPALTSIGSFVWLWLWKRGAFKEEIVAHLLGLAGLFIAINSLRENFDEDAVSIVLVIAGAIGLWLYVQSHAWPYILFGLGSILMGGIQMLFKYVEGVGGALASMALGAVLVIVGIRLVKDQSQTEHG